MHVGVPIAKGGDAYNITLVGTNVRLAVEIAVAPGGELIATVMEVMTENVAGYVHAQVIPLSIAKAADGVFTIKIGQQKTPNEGSDGHE